MIAGLIYDPILGRLRKKDPAAAQTPPTQAEVLAALKYYDEDTTNPATAPVASGSFSIAQGDGATSTVNYSTVSGGLTNSATGVGSSIGGGQLNTSAGLNSRISGGLSNTISSGGTHATICGGNANGASGVASVVLGGQENDSDGDFSTSRGHYAQANEDGGNATSFDRQHNQSGSAQNQKLTRSIEVTDDTPTDITLPITTADKTFACLIRVSGRQTGGTAGTVGDSFYDEFKILVKDIGGVNSKVGSYTEDTIAEDNSNWVRTIAVTASGVIITFTGEVDQTITVLAEMDRGETA